MFACFLLGGMGLALAIGLLDVFVLHADAIVTRGLAAERGESAGRWRAGRHSPGAQVPVSRGSPGPGWRFPASHMPPLATVPPCPAGLGQA